MPILSNYLIDSLSALTGKDLTFTDAGFGLVMMNSPGLKGLGLRSPPLLAAVFLVLSFISPGRVSTPEPFLPKFFATTLSAENFEQIYVPPGLAHGFLVTSEVAQVEYKVTAPWDPKAEFSIAWDDPDLAIPWPDRSPLLSEKDRRAPRLRDVQDRLLDYRA